jgi:hypothetical protein
MSAPVDAILDTIAERGTHGTEDDLCARFTDLSSSDLLAAMFAEIDFALDDTETSAETDDRLCVLEKLATVLAHRSEPRAWRRALALRDPDFEFSEPVPVI